MAYTTDPVADLLTRIRNATTANHDSLEISGSKLKVEILKILHREGFIKAYEVIKDPKQDRIKIQLKFGPKRERAISGIKRISKPGLRIYAGHDNLPRVLQGLGIAILTTSRGLMTDREARKQGIGGEVLCHVW
jgi:small subunit ribosomal protein S8